MPATQPRQGEFNDFNETAITVTIETLDQLNQRLLQGRAGGGKKLGCPSSQELCRRNQPMDRTASKQPTQCCEQRGLGGWLQPLFGGLCERKCRKKRYTADADGGPHLTHRFSQLVLERLSFSQRESLYLEPVCMFYLHRHRHIALQLREVGHNLRKGH